MIQVSAKAVQWFKENVEAKSGDAIRFYVRLGGCGTVQSGFSLGIAKEQPRVPEVKTEEDGITFYIEREDYWYLDGKPLVVDVDDSNGEVTFQTVTDL